MSRDIDLESPLNAADAQYVAERPWLLADAKIQGIEVTYLDVEEEPETYTGDTWKKADLLNEIIARNAEYDEDEQIVPESEKNADLIAALLADDAGHAEAEQPE